MAVTSPETAQRAGEVLLARGVGAALVKLPNGGCAVVGPGVRAHVAAPPVEAVDSTGAGDAFAGALGVALLEGKDVVDAARLAVAAATLKVRHYGARTWKPTRRAIEELARSTAATLSS